MCQSGFLGLLLLNLSILLLEIYLIYHLIENDCSLQIKCKDDCSARGVCMSDGKCSCYPGWAGEVCDLMVPCPLNCTSADNGLCQTDSKCKCFAIYSGEACESLIGGEKKDICPKNCSGNGLCNKFTGFCICNVKDFFYYQ